MPDLFRDWIGSINEKHTDVFKDFGIDHDELSNEYPSFMINRALSQNHDTIAFANYVNINAESMPPKMQYDFLMNSISKKKRFAKWAKAENSEKINVIKKAYGYSQKKAEMVEKLFSEADIAALVDAMYEGGKVGK